MSISAMQQALEALELNLPVIEDYGDKEQFNRQHRAIASLYDALRQTIEQAEKQAEKQEPVACSTGLCHFTLTQTNVGIGDRGMQAYEEAKRRGWVCDEAIPAKGKKI